MSAALSQDQLKALPSSFGLSGMPTAVKRLRGATGAAVRKLQAGGLLTGVPVEILVGFTAGTFLGANTTDATSGAGLAVLFHEMGLFQITGGPARRDAWGRPTTRAPVQDTDDSNDWRRLHKDPQVVAALGRKATMVPDAWRNATDDQFAVGMASLRDYYRGIVARLPAALRPSGWNTPWGVAMMFMSFSAGAGGAEEVFELHPELASIPEALRFGAMVHRICLDLQDGRQDLTGRPNRHSDREHRLLRTWQKFELARQMAEHEGLDASFYDLGLGAQQAAHERIVLRANWNLPPDPTDRVRPIDWTAPISRQPIAPWIAQLHALGHRGSGAPSIEEFQRRYNATHGGADLGVDALAGPLTRAALARACAEAGLRVP